MTTLSRSLAVTLIGAATLAPAPPAQAHDSWTPSVSWQAATVDFRGTVNADVYRAILDDKLDDLADYANALRAKVAAIPVDTVLTGMERRAAKARLAKAAWIGAALDRIPTSGTYAPTAAQQATIAGIRADLAATVTRLKELLANEPPAPAPVAVKPVTKTLSLRDALKVLGTRFDRDGDRDHECDGRWGDWDRDGDRDWDGDRDGR